MNHVMKEVTSIESSNNAAYLFNGISLHIIIWNQFNSLFQDNTFSVGVIKKLNSNPYFSSSSFVYPIRFIHKYRGGAQHGGFGCHGGAFTVQK